MPFNINILIHTKKERARGHVYYFKPRYYSIDFSAHRYIIKFQLICIVYYGFTHKAINLPSCLLCRQTFFKRMLTINMCYNCESDIYVEFVEISVTPPNISLTKTHFTLYIFQMTLKLFST